MTGRTSCVYPEPTRWPGRREGGCCFAVDVRVRMTRSLPSCCAALGANPVADLAPPMPNCASGWPLAPFFLSAWRSAYRAGMCRAKCLYGQTALALREFKSSSSPCWRLHQTPPPRPFLPAGIHVPMRDQHRLDLRSDGDECSGAGNGALPQPQRKLAQGHVRRRSPGNRSATASPMRDPR